MLGEKVCKGKKRPASNCSKKTVPSFFKKALFQNFSISLLWWRRRQWHPTPVLLPRKSHGRRSLEGCSPRGRKESDMTERLHFHALGKEMAPHSSVLAWRIPGTGSLVGCCLRGRRGSDTTEATQQRRLLWWSSSHCQRSFDRIP